MNILDLRDELNICFPEYLIEYLLSFVWRYVDIVQISLEKYKIDLLA